jgi:DNA-binding PucR family transcriptional regulator
MTNRADSPDALRQVLLARLRARSSEVEEAIVATGQSIEPEVSATPEGRAVLRASASETIETIATAIEQGEGWLPGLSPAGTAQIRYLARNDVPLDTVMRAFYAVTSVLLEFLTEEIADLPPDALPYLVGIQSQHGDQLMSAISAEYEEEVARMERSPAKRIAECVEKLLAGERVDLSDLEYDLEAWHLGMIAIGTKVDRTVRVLAERLGCALLILPRNAETAWVWLGASRAVPFAELERFVSSGAADSVSLAAGEMRHGVEGWRLTHREAQTALAVMLQRPQPLVRASNVVLLAAAIQDETVRRSLLDTYLGPLSGRRDAGVLRETLHVYFSLDCNAASAAATLGVNRHTVLRRLLRIEKAIGRSLDACRAEMDVALRIEQLDSDRL